MSVPADAVGADLPASIGPVDTTLTVQSFEVTRRQVSYKQDTVTVKAAADGSAREGGVLSVEVKLTLTEWRRLCDAARKGGGGDA